MTKAGVATFDIECPVHAAAGTCEYRSFTPTPNLPGTIMGLCEKCGYQIEVSNAFGMRYRFMETGETMSVEHFERTRPKC